MFKRCMLWLGENSWSGGCDMDKCQDLSAVMFVKSKVYCCIFFFFHGRWCRHGTVPQFWLPCGLLSLIKKNWLWDQQRFNWDHHDFVILNLFRHTVCNFAKSKHSEHHHTIDWSNFNSVFSSCSISVGIRTWIAWSSLEQISKSK
jgi:hypothetical protein